MAPEAAKHLFEPFFTTKPRGTGLGLLLARERVARCGGGTLEVENVPEGGARFRIRLRSPSSQTLGGGSPVRANGTGSAPGTGRAQGPEP